MLVEASHGVTTLSEDLLQLLFERVLDRNNPKAYHDQLTDLRLVCRGWNTLIESWGHLWTIISIRRPLETTRAQLTRSGDSLLEVDMTIPLNTFIHATEVAYWTERTEALAGGLTPEARRIGVWRISNQLILAGPHVRVLLSHPLPSLAELHSQKPKMEARNRFGLVQNHLPDLWTNATLTPFVHRLIGDAPDQTAPIPTIYMVVHATFVSLRSAHLYLYFEDISIPRLVEVVAATIGEKNISLTMTGKMPSGILAELGGLSHAVVELIWEEEAAISLSALHYQRPEGSLNWIFPGLQSMDIRLPFLINAFSQTSRGRFYKELLRDLKVRSQGRDQVAPAPLVTLRVSGLTEWLSANMVTQLRKYASDVVVE